MSEEGRRMAEQSEGKRTTAVGDWPPGLTVILASTEPIHVQDQINALHPEYRLEHYSTAYAGCVTKGTSDLRQHRVMHTAVLVKN